jgi:LPS O-antigen subunit length determinant protein (WzzB/FepE family)
MEQREFIETRVEDAQAELLGAEDQLQRFLEQNRQFQDSPQLQFEYERLQRQVAIKQQILTSLRRSYEEARIQEVNDTPVLTVIDAANIPKEKSSPKRKVIVAVSLLMGGMIGLVVAFTKEYFGHVSSSDQAKHREFGELWSTMARDIKSPRAWFR